MKHLNESEVQVVLTGTGGLNRLKSVKTGQNWSKLINWPQRLAKSPTSHVHLSLYMIVKYVVLF